jgi:CheY-like chemotaxis protein
MEKGKPMVPPPGQEDRTRRKAGKARKRGVLPKAPASPERTEAPKRIAEIRTEAEFHQGCAAALKTQLERLASKTFEEILKVKELINVLETLEQNENQREGDTVSSPAPGEETVPPPLKDKKDLWKIELERELERLLIIKKLLKVPPPPPAADAEPAGPPASGRMKKILVVDDDPISLKIISHFLQKEDFQVSASLSGVEGLKKAFEENPDLILLDVMMPDLNGFQFLSIYRKAEENDRTPVVILSSLAEEEDVLKGLEIGAADYLTKPFSPQVLIAKIKKNISIGP